jgi:serine/threonine protein kinase
MAEQLQPMRRKVALKIVKPGMDTRQVIARFEAERQALALMDHPNIARVYDGGTTEAGQPFFVMELVSGVPITDYCDRQRLAVRARLELFVSVCQAVQHAHQKGIIHRDLKPSNVLVTEVDGRPTPQREFGNLSGLDKFAEIVIISVRRKSNFNRGMDQRWKIIRTESLMTPTYLMPNGQSLSHSSLAARVLGGPAK